MPPKFYLESHRNETYKQRSSDFRDTQSMQEEVKEVLEGISPDDIEDDAVRETVYALINIIEKLAHENQQLREENQKLRDKIKTLKGGNPRPDQAEDSSSDSPSDRSTSGKADEKKEKENEETVSDEEECRNDAIEVDREEILEMEEEKLPEDAEFKGYEERLVQEIVIETDNVLYKREKYYSPSRNKTYVAEMPEGVKGGYGPQLTTLALTLTYACNVTMNKIKKLFTYIGVVISKPTLSNLLTEGWEEFYRETDQIREQAKQATPNQVFDHTGMKVNGTNKHCGILSTEYSTVFQVTESKNRHNVIKAISGIRDPTYRLDEETIQQLKKTRIAKSVIEELQQLVCDEAFCEEAFLERVRNGVPDAGPQQVRWIKEAGLYSWVVRTGRWNLERMICDNAREFLHLTDRCLCWIHEGRHYEELAPLAPQFKEKLDGFLEAFWTFYDRLRAFRSNPTQTEADQLEEEFDELFSRETGYQQLDNRIERTRKKKKELLRVLEDPTIPLHNSWAELGARKLVVKRKISQQTRSEKGTRCWESFLSILETTKKLGVNFFDYLEDRIKGTGQMPSLPDLISQKEIPRNPNWSYSLNC